MKDETMIYTVECSFADAGSEAEWNHFYSDEKLPALISVTGFHTSQRFKSIGVGCPVYLAIHTIDGPEVLAGEEYREKGGGNFARWQKHITDWHRNVYSDIGLAPAVNADELLVLSSSGPDHLIRMGLAPLAMEAVGLDKSPERRWLAKIPRSSAHLAESMPEDVHLYEPMTERLVSARVASTGQKK